MNRIVAFLSMLIICLFQANAWDVFLPSKNGDYTRVKMPDSVDTLNDLYEHLGYGPLRHYSYIVSDNEDVDMVLFKAFSSDIIAVIPTQNNVAESLSKTTLNVALKDFDYVDEFSAYNRHSNLQKAIDNKSYDKSFFCDVLHIPLQSVANTNTITDRKHDLIYTFDKDGILIGFSSISGLRRSAQEAKEVSPNFFNEMSTYVKGFWTDDKNEYLNEINAQIEAFYSLPGGWTNKYLDVVHIRGNVYNFIILDFILNDRKLNLSDFKKYTHNNYRLISTKQTPVGKILTYRYMDINFLYDGDGEFIEWNLD